MSNIIIATRKSPLALWQAEFVARKLRKLEPTVSVELLPLTTTGDRRLGNSLANIGGKGLFLKELEKALLDCRADIAVHSMKDVPIRLPEGLAISAVLQRHDPFDAWVSLDGSLIGAGKEKQRVGTSSARRMGQLKFFYPELEFMPLRGNIHTRLGKLDAGEFDGIILAAAGLRRMGLDKRITVVLDTSVCLPAVGQGIIGIEGRIDDDRVCDLMAKLNDRESALNLAAERAVSRHLDADCQLPLAAFSTLNKQRLSITGVVVSPEGNKCLRAKLEGYVENVEQAAQLGVQVAEKLKAQGGDNILNEIRQHPA